MKKFLTLKRLLMGGGVFSLVAILLYLCCDSFYDPNFRTMQDPIASVEGVNLAGLQSLDASGSRMPHFVVLRESLKNVKKNIVVFNTRNKFYGYIEGTPTEYLSYNRSPDIRHFHRHLRHLRRRLFYTGSIFKRPELLRDEGEEAKRYGFDYVNIEIGSKYITPDKSVDEFMTFFDNLQQESWVHFHCDQGQGRTSIALIMYDILRNAPTVSLKDIVKRQQLLGSVDVLDTRVWKKGSTYTKEMLEARKKFVEDFYAFVSQRKVGGIQSWIDWCAQQKVKAAAH